MSTPLRNFTLFAATLILWMAPASAAVRTFFAPQIDGFRAAICLADGQSCGKPAADAWCQANGWKQALMFQRETTPAVTRLVDTGELCSGPACLPFKQIKCFKPETAKLLDSGNG